MFTLKHVTPYGNEAIYETEEIMYTPRAEHLPHTNPALGPSTGQLWYTSRSTGERVDLNDGNVYVMNDHGSTVGKYDLGGWARTPGPV